MVLGYWGMDKSIVAVEESHTRSDSLASASKSLGSLVQINSITIDISCAMDKEIESPAHDHFSIRGFVAGMRKRDWKICSPFALEGDGDHDLVDNLPPLSVPGFRWWQCSNCVPDVATVDASTSSFQNVDGGKDGFLLHSIGNIGDGYQEDNDLCNEIINSDPQYTERHKATTCSKVDIGNSERVNPCDCIRDGNPIPIRERHGNATDASDTVRVDENPPIGVDEPENASSGSDSAFRALPNKRKPKLRSLADIMEEEKNSTNEHSRIRSASSSGIQVTSTEMETDLDPQIQVDVPADVAKDTQSPPKKRKIALEEDRGPLETAHPIITAKRLKGPIPFAEKACRRVEISDSERDGDVFRQSDLQLGAKTQQIKPRKNKALDINRKIRQNIQKCADAAESGFGKMGHVPSTPGGEMEPYFGSFLPEQRMDRIYNLSKSKRPEVEADHSLLMPPSKSISGDSNIQGKVALDLSLNGCLGAERNSNNQESFVQHRGIPDLNESLTEKISTTQIQPYKTSDMFLSSSKETAREGKRQSGVSDPQVVQNMATNLEPEGASDDIPMEIVELLAKNQRERALGNPRKHLHNSVNGSSAIYSNERLINGTISFPFTKTRSGASVSGIKTGVGQGILSFPHVKNYHLDMANPDESQFRVFSSFAPSQQRKPQYSSSTSIVSAPRTSDGADLLWPPRRKNMPFHLSIPENQTIQPNGFSVHIKGKEKQAIRDASAVKDAYSNDTIPAMQLLSLMDRGIVSTSSFKMSPNSFLDKPFSPCNHHTQLNGNENQNDPFLNGSFLPQSSHTKANFPGLLNGVCFSGESFKKSYLPGQKPPEQENLKSIPLDSPNSLLTQPSRGNLSLEICTLNRNPADFSIPDARNKFTISAKDLKPRNRNALKVRSRPLNVEGHKRSKAKKIASGKECSRK